jgi:Fe-S-cluster containining protein
MSKDRLADLTERVLGQMDLSLCNGCDRCSLRCTEGVPMSRREFDDVCRLIESLPGSAAATAAAGPGREVDLGDGVFVRRCRFHDDDAGRCLIYPARPLVCRLMGHVEWMPCPIGAVPRTADTPLALELLRAYAEQERRTFDEWERLS